MFFRLIRFIVLIVLLPVLVTWLLVEQHLLLLEVMFLQVIHTAYRLIILVGGVVYRFYKAMNCVEQYKIIQVGFLFSERVQVIRSS